MEQELLLAQKNFYALQFTTPAIAATILVKIADPILRARIGFAGQQFGPVSAAFDTDKREVTAYGPVSSLNMMLRGLIWYWDDADVDGFVSEKMWALRQPPEQILVQLRIADSLNLERIYNSPPVEGGGNHPKNQEFLRNDFLSLARFKENVGPTIRVSATSPCEKGSMAHHLVEKTHLWKSRNFLIGRERTQRLSNRICDPDGHTLSFSVQCQTIGVVSYSFWRYFSDDPGGVSDTAPFLTSSDDVAQVGSDEVRYALIVLVIHLFIAGIA